MLLIAFFASQLILPTQSVKAENHFDPCDMVQEEGEPIQHFGIELAYAIARQAPVYCGLDETIEREDFNLFLLKATGCSADTPFGKYLIESSQKFWNFSIGQLLEKPEMTDEQALATIEAQKQQNPEEYEQTCKEMSVAHSRLVSEINALKGNEK